MCSCLAAAYSSARWSTSGTPKYVQRGPGPGHPRHARHHLLVHRRGEPLRRPRGAVTDVAPLALHQLLQGLAPGQLVRGVDQNPVHVEDRTLEGRAMLRHVPHRSLGLASSAVSADASTLRSAAEHPPFPRYCRAEPGELGAGRPPCTSPTEGHGAVRDGTGPVAGGQPSAAPAAATACHRAPGHSTSFRVFLPSSSGSLSALLPSPRVVARSRTALSASPARRCDSRSPTTCR